MDDRAKGVKILKQFQFQHRQLKGEKNTIFFFQRYFGRGWIREKERDKGKKDVPNLKPGSFLYIFERRVTDGVKNTKRKKNFFKK